MFICSVGWSLRVHKMQCVMGGLVCRIADMICKNSLLALSLSTLLSITRCSMLIYSKLMTFVQYGAQCDGISAPCKEGWMPPQNVIHSNRQHYTKVNFISLNALGNMHASAEAHCTNFLMQKCRRESVEN